MIDSDERVILVNEQDEPTGTMDKLEAHRKGLLHRALSVFIFNSKGQLLMQRRAKGKYHSADLWTNTCCSHPRPGEGTLEAAVRRTREEMGIECVLEPGFTFLYRAQVGRDLVEHELDHTFFGTFDGEAMPDPAEASAVRWVGTEELTAALLSDPQHFTAWLAVCWPKVLERRATNP